MILVHAVWETPFSGRIPSDPVAVSTSCPAFRRVFTPFGGLLREDHREG